MAEALPDPTRSDARALILGAGTFWAAWGLAASTLFLNGWLIGLVPFFLGLAAGGWLYFGGVFGVAARGEGTTAGRLYLRQIRRSPWKAFSDSLGGSWVRALRPAYFRRAARILGWPEGVVLGVLGTLLATDLVVFVWMMVGSPSPSRG